MDGQKCFVSRGGWRNAAVWLLFSLFAMSLRSQESQYEQMKNDMDGWSLPLVNLTVDVAAMGKDHFVDAEMEMTDFYEGAAHYRCLLRVRGGSSSLYQKKSFAMKLVDESGEKLDANLLGIREENSWILDAMAIDRIRMRNRVCFDVWNEMSGTPYETEFGGRNGTAGRFVEVFLNGAYYGLYCLSDKVDRKLLGLKKVKADGENGVTIRGVLYKGVTWGTGWNLLSYVEARTDLDRWNAWELQYPEDEPCAEAWQPLMDLIDFCSPQTGDATFVSEYQAFFYPQNLLDYVVFTLAMGVGDNAYKNTFLSVVDVTKAHRFLLTPWDMDMSLGGHWSGKRDGNLMQVGRYDTIAPFNRLHVQNMDGFADEMKVRWEEAREGMLSVDGVGARLDAYAEVFKRSGAWQREYERWNNNPVPLQADLADELNYVKGWYERNYNSLCDQLADASDICSPDECGDMPVVIYTLDGRRLNARHLHALPQGVYVVNGKKWVVRHTE